MALRLLPFHADQPPDQQAAALAPPLGSHCHVVLATEGGDTALTFPNVVATPTGEPPPPPWLQSPGPRFCSACDMHARGCLQRAESE